MSVNALRMFPHNLCSSFKLSCQCLNDFPPQYLLILQAVLSLGRMRPVQGMMSLLKPFPLHGFFQGSHHQMGFLHEFVNQMGPFPWFHGYTPPWRLAWQATLL